MTREPSIPSAEQLASRLAPCLAPRTPTPTSAKMKSCVFAALSLQLFSCAVAQTCDHQYDTVSAACCEGAPARRLADGAGLLDIGVCTLPSTCKPACAKVYSAFYKKCGQSMMLTGAKYSQYVTTCKIGSASVGGFKKLRARCNANYQQNARFPAGTTRAAATKMCAKNSTCAGVYVTSCASNTSALYMCLPNLYFQPSTYACVLANPKMALVAPPTDACLSSPCQHGGTCRSYISGATSRYSCNCPHASTSNLASTAASAYFGAHCESKWVNTCASNPCQNGATCRPSTYTSSYSCSCAKDTTAAVLYGGTNCGTQFVDPCKSAPCMNGGTCQSSASTYSKTASYYCRCATGYLGNACDMQRAPPAATCKSSKLQTCKMLCNNGPQCKPGQCLMHTDSCCGRECRALTCSEDDCCYSKTSRTGILRVCARGGVAVIHARSSAACRARLLGPAHRARLICSVSASEQQWAPQA